MRMLLVAGLLAAPVVSAQTSPRFEIAEIHRSAGAINPFTLVSGGVLRGERYDLRKATMLDLIRIAWNVAPETVAGGPPWLEFDRYDIAAKAPSTSSPETVRLMLQSLLAERFHLAVHKDTRPMPAYALAAAKTKPKMRESDGMGDADCRYQRQPDGSVWTAYACRNITMAAFAVQLRGLGGDYLREPVVDATGIEGVWDFDLRWNRRSQLLQGGAERTTIFDAVEKQLGLNLVLREASAPVLVVDSVNEEPTANAPDVTGKLPPRESEFEVADLKLNRTGQGDERLQQSRNGLEAHAVSLKTLMGFAWDMDWDHVDDRFAGLPRGIESVYVDIHARTSANTNGGPPEGSGFIDDDLRAMVRVLLTERFQIKWHYEDRPVEAYSLFAGKPKLKKADPANRASCKQAHTIANDPRDSNPLLAYLISCQNATIGQFTSKLQELVSENFVYPVEDATGIPGRFDFTLSFTPAYLLRTAQADRNSSEPNGAISLEEALRGQLGLTLEKRKRKLPVIVIDHMEEKPLEN